MNVAEFVDGINPDAFLELRRAVEVRRRREKDGECREALGVALGDPVPLNVVVAAHCRAVLADCDDVRAEAAERLGIGERTLYRWLAATEEPVAPFWKRPRAASPKAKAGAS